VVSFG